MTDESADHAASIEVAFPMAVYGVEAVKRAAYVFMAKASCDIELTNADIVCRLVANAANEDVEKLVRDFKREVLDQDLRISIELQTEPMRNAVLGFTF